ncbi:T9SS type A sorting domain-containing protein [Pseudotamlana carrageenivorans]|uniref:Secretion system C-terminal sorting domain-containing protein n=1 Tax=Pseudotamlana carrageenivorans TaxID=2069432 RepID=A0A2I7SE54_9FLAO|nr:T9SS type A sorting domain-containing protein [Tamlana carrageenivorans]AUS04185.1 hypothetical protein C1A40_01240 [Tamlana carrageenivorans]
MKTKLLVSSIFCGALSLFSSRLMAQGDSTYSWTGSAGSNFYSTSNWTSTVGAVQFDNNGFKVVRTSTQGSSPSIDSFIDWQPGIFDNLDNVNLTVNADFNVFFNDWLNGTVTVNTGATFTCRNIFRVGREGVGTVNIEGGTLQANDPTNWQAVFVGALNNGDGTVNVNNNGTINGGYQVEIGTRDFYPLGELNVNTGGTSLAYWATKIGPNGILNVNGGTVNTGRDLFVGDLFLDNAGNIGSLTLTADTGNLNINSGTVTVNHNNLDTPTFSVHADAKIYIDNGTLVINNNAYDYTTDINTMVANGQIVPASGKVIKVSNDGLATTVTAENALSITDHDFASQISVYPNPSNGIINIKTSQNYSEALSLKVFNTVGKLIFKAPLKNIVLNTYSFDTKNILKKGMYVLQITSSNNQSYYTKLVRK